MELSQVVEGLRTERNKTAAQLATLDAAIASLTGLPAVSTSSPKIPPKKSVWTAERRAKLSASLKKAFAAKKKAAKNKGATA